MEEIAETNVSRERVGDDATFSLPITDKSDKIHSPSARTYAARPQLRIYTWTCRMGSEQRKCIKLNQVSSNGRNFFNETLNTEKIVENS